MRRRIILFLLVLLPFVVLPGQTSGVLDGYVEQALESNIALQRKDLSYEASLAALEEAKANFWPTVSLQARYSVARGGRAFEVPIGDLMNPVYNNLNILNELAQDAAPDYPAFPEYPMIENQQINFLRETEQETFVRVAWPVFNAAIINNQKIRENLAQAGRSSVETYRRELVKEVKTAYFNYLKAVEGVTLFENAKTLVEENLRTSESLYRNHQVTIDEVYAAEAQVQSVEQQLAQARKQERVAGAYFNFLLNRDHDVAIVVESLPALAMEAISLEEARLGALRKREEFQQLNYYLAASDGKVQLTRGELLPTVNLVGDYGIQGINYAVDKDSDFAMGSVLLRWNLFDPTRKFKVEQARIDRNEVAKQKEELAQQVSLQVVEQFYELEVNRENIESARAEVDAANSAFRLIRKKYSQGQANQVELTNARVLLTNAERKLIIARFDYQIGLAKMERVIGSFEF